MKDALPLSVVQSYQEPLQDTLPGTAFDMTRQRGTYAVAQAVATSKGCIAQPLACAEACHVTAYAILKAAELHKIQSWTGSILTDLQQQFSNKYEAIDFAFWVRTHLCITRRYQSWDPPAAPRTAVVAKWQL